MIKCYTTCTHRTMVRDGFKERFSIKNKRSWNCGASVIVGLSNKVLRVYNLEKNTSSPSSPAFVSGSFYCMW